MLCSECKKNWVYTKIERGKFSCRGFGHPVLPLIKITNPPTVQEETANMRVANWLLYLLLTVALTCFFGIFLYFIGKLPPYISNFANYSMIIIGLVFAVIGGIQIKTYFIVRVWHFANKRFLFILLSSLTIFTLIALDLFVIVGWYPLLSQTVPYCDNSKGWSIPNNMQEGTSKLDCSSGTVLRLYQHSPKRAHYAELDLNSVKSQPYSQTYFRVKVDVSFEKQDEYTFGCIIVQTVVGQPAGYILCVNYLGKWKLEDATHIGAAPSGTISTGLNQPIKLMVEVQYGQLFVIINNQQVFAMPDTLTSGVVGLIVEKNGQIQSSPIFYSNFELDKSFIG